MSFSSKTFMSLVCIDSYKPRLGNQHNLQIHQVVAGAPRFDVASKRIKKVIAVVVGQVFIGIHFFNGGVFDSGLIHNSPGCIGRAVNAISAGTQEYNLAIKTGKIFCHAQSKLLVSSTKAIAVNFYGALSVVDQRSWGVFFLVQNFVDVIHNLFLKIIDTAGPDLIGDGSFEPLGFQNIGAVPGHAGSRRYDE